MTAKVTAFAPAKINLTLHVTGRRADGYHLLDSLVVFADIGDQITVQPATDLSLKVHGPMARGVPADKSNLVLKAAAMFDTGQGAALDLHKDLPAASGIGGGSSDAAAALRALSQFWKKSLPTAQDCLALGADVPVCLNPKPQRMSGIGEQLQLLSGIPDCPVLLVNPGVSVPTPLIFKALKTPDNAPMQDQIPSFSAAADFVAWLKKQRNDLQAPALQTAPIIGKVLETLRDLPGCALARMSGSGATCFAIFSDRNQLVQAAQNLKRTHPDWWVRTGLLQGAS
ncbi:4-(cytidine 5'-diphospho)-2-C-methyl-D-erythritol kinase [Cognatishimia sp. WU-CL00825]|uniref:4-(cytidine 5'-diphospho)-2-C-methyl-D-erythritol kinase n=1 Tax=Cognatishimia sp. WU-CL00825 TaxID=3127658 RepID=UPI00310240C7